MANNYDDYGYENDNNSSTFKKILIVVMVIISILIIVFLLKSCGSGGKDNNGTNFDYESALLNAGKSYFDNNKDEYPDQVGECNQVELQKLIDRGLIDKTKWDGCNTTATYLRVCMLSNGNKQYTPWISCPNKKSEEEYDVSKVGELKDIVTNESYVEFKFLPEVMKAEDANLGKEETYWKDEIPYQNYKTISSTTYYKYRDKLFKWDVTTKTYYTSKGDVNDAKKVNEYYTVAPNSNYKLYDNKTTEAYKWYTTDAVKEYALTSSGVKAVSHVPIGEYKYKEGIKDGQGMLVDMYSIGTATSLKPTKFNLCSIENKTDSKTVILTPYECGTTDKKYKYDIGDMYACVKSASDSPIENEVKSATSKCYDWSDWSPSTSCDPAKDNCRKDKIAVYYWYKLKEGGNKKYYPSNSSTASGEKVYYTSAPIEGAIKDTSTKATAYKWYKSSTKTTTEYSAVAPSGYASASRSTEYKWGNWSTDWSATNPKVSDGRVREIQQKVKIKLREIVGADDGAWVALGNNNEYLTLDEMIELLKTNKYEVSSLDDIANHGSVRYQVKMYIRNKKEIKK